MERCPAGGHECSGLNPCPSMRTGFLRVRLIPLPSNTDVNWCVYNVAEMDGLLRDSADKKTDGDNHPNRRAWFIQQVPRWAGHLREVRVQGAELEIVP